MGNKISVIIPVFNEDAVINHSLEQLFTQSGADFEVIVVDCGPDKRTINEIKRETVKKVISEKGRGRQMNKGASCAVGDILLFLHADTVLPENALEMISRAVDRSGFAAGAFRLGIRSEKTVFRIIERGAAFRTRLTGIPYGDQAIFIKKSFFNSIGGFSDIPLMEDVDLMRRTKKAGGNIHVMREKALTSPRRWEREGVVYCTLRNWALISLYFMGVHPDRLYKFYR